MMRQNKQSHPETDGSRTDAKVVEPPAGRFVIGVWGGQRSHDVRGYYAAGKRLPSWVLAFSSNATE